MYNCLFVYETFCIYTLSVDLFGNVAYVNIVSKKICFEYIVQTNTQKSDIPLVL